MPNTLSATPHASGNALTEAAVVSQDGTFPGATTYPGGDTPISLTVSGNEITDATRTTNTQGDGRAAPDSSFGIWEGTTNLIPNGGGEVDATNWFAAKGDGDAVARSTVKAKFGAASIAATTPGTNPDEGGFARTGNGLGLATGTTITGSIWVCPAAGIQVWFFLRISNTDASITTYPTRSLTVTGDGTTWFRLSASLAVDPGKTGDHVMVGARTMPTTATTFYMDGVQVEQKALATPYVETNGATASRTAARVQAPASLLNATQGWVAMRVRMGFASAASANNRIFWWGVNDSCISVQTTTTTLQAISDSGPNDIANFSLTWAADDIITVVCRWTATQISLSGNGAAFGAPATRTAVPSIAASTFGIGLQEDGSTQGQIDGDILWFACGKGTLTNADAATLNALGNVDPLVDPLPATAQLTAIWPANTAALDPAPSKLYPGRGTTLGAGLTSPRTLSEAPA